MCTERNPSARSFIVTECNLNLFLSFRSTHRIEQNPHAHNIYQMAALSTFFLVSVFMCHLFGSVVPLEVDGTLFFFFFVFFFSVFFRCQNNFHRVDSVWFLLFSFITANQQHYYYCCACACACSFDLSSVHCAESGTIPKSCFAYLRWLLAKPYPARNTTFSTFSVAPLSPLSHSLPLA